MADTADEQTSVGRQAIRIFRAARRRRLNARPKHQPCLSLLFNLPGSSM
jgi:hypothetical protein